MRQIELRAVGGADQQIVFEVEHIAHAPDRRPSHQRADNAPDTQDDTDDGGGPRQRDVVVALVENREPEADAGHIRQSGVAG